MGVGPAGCAAAYDLCQRGRSVLLLDRYDSPRRKPCGGGLTVKTLRALRYPVDQVVQRTCSTVRVSLRFAKQRSLSAAAPLCAMVVREEFDCFCFQQTCRAGARFLKTRKLRDLEVRADGVRIATDLGDLTGRFVVGADGVDSQVGRLSGQFRPLTSAVAVEGRVPLEDAGQWDMALDFGVIERGYGWMFPKRDHINIGLATLAGADHPSPGHLAAYAARKLPGHALVEPAGRRLAIGGLAYEPTSPRVFLVGDAAGLVEPLLGEGIYHAIVSGQAAAAAIEHELATGRSALTEFRRSLRPIRSELRACERSARLCHQHPAIGYAILTNPLVRHALLRGFSGGLTFHTIKRFWWLSPLFPRRAGLLHAAPQFRP